MQHTINLQIDDYSETATIYLDNKLIMTGNFWEFTPSYSLIEWGDFRGYLGLVKAISDKMSKSGDTIKLIKEKYTHEKIYL
jgi:hypothetical protein